MRFLKRSRRLRRTAARPRERKGIALFVSMFFVAGVGALALSAIYLTANADLLSKTYEKEDDLKYISEAALQIGKSELNFNPAALPNTSFVQLMNNKPMPTADGSFVPGLRVNLFVGPSGSTSGQFGRFASVVAEARDANGTGFVRRLELTQESFAKYAYWTNSENNASGGTIVFGGGDALWGPVWSNDTININSTGATFHDNVGTAAPTIVGASYGTFFKGYQVKQPRINLPTLTSLSSLSGLATVSGFNFTTPNTGNETAVLERIEFIAIDLDASGDSTGTAEGFFRVYKANSGKQHWLRGDFQSDSAHIPRADTVYNCGDWHRTNYPGLGSTDTMPKFFPWAAHYHSSSSNTWYDTVVARGMPGGLGALKIAANVAAARREADSVTSTSTFDDVLQTHANLRCYLGGDPHLVSVARTSALGYSAADIHKGGDDTTFTPTDQFGAWQLYSNSPPAAVTAARSLSQAKYLFPLYRGYNTNTKGVIYAGGTVGVSGVVRGVVTLYTPNTLVILDDLRYANDPANGVCIDIIGTISGANTIVADNGLNTPQAVKVSGTKIYRSMDDTPDLYLHDVVMALGTSFAVEDYDQNPDHALTCGTTQDGHGCLYLTGGLIQNNRGAVGTTTGTGYTKRYSYDRCAIVNPPPYFPTTGRFQDNRYYELDPVRVNSSVSGSIKQLFQSITP
jgi:hypothetical protein